MFSIADHIRRIAAEAEKPSRFKYEPEKVRVYFSAPDEPTTEEISSKGGNFQWTKYELLFKRTELKDGKPVSIKYYKYVTPLYPWGEEAPGGQEVLDADPKITEADMTPEEAKRALRKYLSKPDLYPRGLSGYYINTKEGEKAYTYEKFNKKFRQSGFYKYVTRTHKLETP